MLNFFKYITKENLLVFLLLCSSGNPIFIYSSYVRELYIIFAIVLFLISFVKKTDAFPKFFSYVSVFFIIAILQQASFNNLSLSSQLFSLLRIFIGVATVRILGDKFVNEYVKVMTVVAAISLVGFAVNTFYGLMPSFNVSRITYSMVLYTQLYTDYGEFVLRNCGMFWEPGAFQGYLNLAIAFALLLPDNKHKRISIAIMTIAILTTYSTTGYVVLSLTVIFSLYYLRISSTPVRIISTVAICIILPYAYYSLDFLNEKIVDNIADTDSGQGRITDYIRYGAVLKDNFLLGINLEDIEFFSGNGLVHMLLYYGAIIVIYYFLKMYICLRQNVSVSVALYLLLVVLLTLQGEGFMFYPLYISLPMIVYRFDRPLSYEKNKC